MWDYFNISDYIYCWCNVSNKAHLGDLNSRLCTHSCTSSTWHRWPQCQCFVTGWMTSWHEEDWNVHGYRAERKFCIVRQPACFCHRWSVWLLRLVAFCGFSQRIWWVKCHATFSQPTTTLSLFHQFPATHPFHTFPQSLATNFRSLWLAKEQRWLTEHDFLFDC